MACRSEREVRGRARLKHFALLRTNQQLYQGVERDPGGKWAVGGPTLNTHHLCLKKNKNFKSKTIVYQYNRVSHRLRWTQLSNLK